MKEKTTSDGHSIKTPEDLLHLREQGRQMLFPSRLKIAVQLGTCGRAAGGGEIYRYLKEKNQPGGMDFILSRTGCLGFCQQEPMVNLFVPGHYPVVYSKLDTRLLSELLPRWLKGEVPHQQALMQLKTDAIESLPEPALIPHTELPFDQHLPYFKHQLKLVLANCGLIDPLNLAEYAARGGYTALYQALHRLSSEQVIEQIAQAGLRGRGGGGFLTARKWQTCRSASDPEKYIICNADEGDPGAYMDRAVLEGDPFRVLEGMTIGAYAVGSSQGYIYVRAEYPLAVETLQSAIELARRYGLLGDNILGSDFSFDIQISRGGGAFVCGESTALMTSMEGRVGEPRVKHIHTVVSGFRNKPTTLNNVETWANVPSIINMGAEQFQRIGTTGSTGTKVFSVVGHIAHNGLVEVPMGATLKEIIYDIGGGIANGKKFKAVQTGGPSGGCLPAGQLDLPVDFDQLTAAGSMMGSGGMIVMDESTCMVEVARYFLHFLVEESCGKCTPCREGLWQLYTIVDRITKGLGAESDLELMEELATFIQDGSLCALGKSSPNPLLSTLRYFKEEFVTHIRDKQCPTGICQGLGNYQIMHSVCTLCGKCWQGCPQQAITAGKKKPELTLPIIIQAQCTKCGICAGLCPRQAIKKEYAGMRGEA